ncbi:E3 ubiquitin-protein ligase RNF213-like [Pelobates fuscus]|uniref:E3 ubiquitin-protein ligase RNF213-like n=1 Tax=Pelobates fuscus TaxID=191477 RepID=UPI002FE4A20D
MVVGKSAQALIDSGSEATLKSVLLQPEPCDTGQMIDIVCTHGDTRTYPKVEFVTEVVNVKCPIVHVAQMQERISKARVSDPEHYVTVYFHIIVSKNFNIDPGNDKVLVRAGGMKEFEDWRGAVCEMRWQRDIDDLGSLMEGHVRIHKENLDTYIPYKYLVIRSNGDVEYEYIYVRSSENVNRCLFIRSAYVSEREWHQYDDVCMKETKNMATKLIQWWTDKFSYLFQAKQMAGNVMLDKIFKALSMCDANSLSRFFNQLLQFYIVHAEPRVFAEKPKIWKSHGFEKHQVKELILRKCNIICESLVNTDSQLENHIIDNRLVAGLVFLQVLQSYNIPTTKEICETICFVLCLEEKIKGSLHKELENIKKIFSVIPRLYNTLLDFCQICIDKGVHHWIWVLPLLHTFSPSKQNDTHTKFIQEDAWAGLEGLEYGKIFTHNKSFFAQVSVQKRNHSLGGDPVGAKPLIKGQLTQSSFFNVRFASEVTNLDIAEKVCRG